MRQPGLWEAHATVFEHRWLVDVVEADGEEGMRGDREDTCIKPLTMFGLAVNENTTGACASIARANGAPPGPGMCTLRHCMIVML